MPSKTPKPKSTLRKANEPADVDTFLASLDHPHKPEILALRQIILDTDPCIAESIKWNAPSFRTSEFFATMHLRAKNGVQLILHFGAKKRADLDAGSKIADPESILEWLAADRAVAKFRDLRDIAAKRTAFTNVIRQWITHV